MYAKVFASLWNGSLVGQSGPQLVFVYLLAHCDLEGFVDIHPRVIASMTGLPEPEVREALKVLESPDPHSRTPGQDGARIERIDGHRDWGWGIVNYKHYRNLVDSDVVREQNRNRQRKRRHALSRSVTLRHAKQK